MTNYIVSLSSTRSDDTRLLVDIIRRISPDYSMGEEDGYLVCSTESESEKKIMEYSEELLGKLVGAVDSLQRGRIILSVDDPGTGDRVDARILLDPGDGF